MGIKQQILEILDKSTNNGMKADEIMELIERQEEARAFCAGQSMTNIENDEGGFSGAR